MFKSVLCHECVSEAAIYYEVHPGVCATQTENRLKVSVFSQPTRLTHFLKQQKEVMLT